MNTTIEMPAEIIEAGESAIALYRESMENGCSESMATMFALRRPPQSNTDREFFAGPGRKTLLDQFDGNEFECNRVVMAAKRRGYTPNYTDHYVPSLAKCVGDPQAFISATGGRGQIKKLCERRGWACEGSVSVRGRKSEPRDKPVVAESLVNKYLAQETAKNPEMTAQQKSDARDSIRKKLSPATS